MPNKSKGPGVNSEGLFSGIAKSIVGGVTGVGAGVAKGIGSIAAAMGVPPAMVAGVSAVLLTASVAGGMGAMSADDLARITSKPDCRETYQAAQVAGASTLNDIDMDAQKRENARIIYSVLKTYNPNLSDAHIAAALSNWDAEGGIDPTSIEGIYDEHYQVGPRKQAAMSDDLASHTVQLMDSYTISINRNAYFASEPGHYMCGMGMAQHTGNGAWAFLSAARGLGVEWSDMGFNIAYNIYTGSPYISACHLEGIEQNVILIDSVSKRYSECGIRIGALITKNQEVRKAVMKFCQARLSPPLIGQIVAEASLDAPEEYYRDVYDEYVERRKCLIDGLNRIPGVYSPIPMGAFYTVAKLPVDDSEKFCRWCLAEFSYEGETVMMAPAAGFYTTPGAGINQVRIAYVLKKEDLERALFVLRKALEAYPGRTE